MQPIFRNLKFYGIVHNFSTWQRLTEIFCSAMQLPLIVLLSVWPWAERTSCSTRGLFIYFFLSVI